MHSHSHSQAALKDEMQVLLSDIAFLHETLEEEQDREIAAVKGKPLPGQDAPTEGACRSHCLHAACRSHYLHAVCIHAYLELIYLRCHDMA